MVIISILPFLFGFFSFLFWLFLRLIKPQKFKKSFLNYAFATFIVISFLFYPTIVNYGFSMFNCIHIEEKLYLQSDMGIECWS